jgi:hypothetical protein
MFTLQILPEKSDGKRGVINFAYSKYMMQHSLLPSNHSPRPPPPHICPPVLLPYNNSHQTELAKQRLSLRDEKNFFNVLSCFPFSRVKPHRVCTNPITAKAMGSTSKRIVSQFQKRKFET